MVAARATATLRYLPIERSDIDADRRLGRSLGGRHHVNIALLDVAVLGCIPRTEVHNNI